MRVVHLSTHESAGGAARAARTLHDALVAAGVDSRMLVRDRNSPDPRVTRVTIDPSSSRLAGEIESGWITRQRSPRSDTFFSVGLAGADVSRREEILAADVLHLHWVAGLLDAPAIGSLLALGKPVVWTLHDEWAFTGGCHYTAGCEKWRDRCDACPQLNRDPLGLVPAHFDEKRRHWSRGRLVGVSPSRWLADRARGSRLLGSVEFAVIPNAVDLDVHVPDGREESRRRLGLAEADVAVLFAADATGERRKGFEHLRAALESIGEGFARIRPIALGDSGTIGLPPRTIRTGRLADRSAIASIIAASDLAVVPSLEDNFPNGVLEALACGTPVVAYATGGIPEALEGSPGPAPVPVGDVAGLAAAIRAVAERLEAFRSLRPALRAFAEGRFDPARQADAHHRLYGRMLAEVGVTS